MRQAPVVDVSGWTVETPEVGGRGENVWLMDPQGQLWWYKPNRIQQHGQEQGEDWAEKVVRSGGHRLGDGIELLPVPTVGDDGRSTTTFLVHGIRHVAGAEAVLASLREGDRVSLVPQPDNVWNSRAMQVASLEPQRPVGWVPNAFVDVIHDLGSPEALLVRINGVEVGPRYRLLVRVSGAVPEGWSPFAGPAWETTA